MHRWLLLFLLILGSAAPTVLATDAGSPDGPVVVPGTADEMGAETAVLSATFPEQVLELVNQARWDNGQLPPLKGSPSLHNAATTHSQNMAVRNFFAHCDLDTKTTPWDRMNAAGYTGWSSASENIAAGYNSPQAVMAGWMSSSGHRANILSANVREIGIGYAFQPDDQNNVRYDAGNCNPDGGGHGPFYRYWTQKFGRIDSVMPVVINREAYETDTRQVALYLYGAGWASQMRFRNENGSWSDWQPYQANVSWQLSGGNGEKTVYAEIRNASGVVRSATDSILLNSPEPQPPTLAVSANSLAFALQADGPLTQTRNLTLYNTGEQPLTWNLSTQPNAPWLNANVTSGNLDGGQNVTVNLTASRGGLATAVYQTTLIVAAGSAINSPQSISVTFLVTEQPPVFLPAITK